MGSSKFRGESKMDAFNDIIDRGNATSIQIAVAGLRAEYEAQEGYEGRMLTGKAAKSSRDIFRSQAEVVQAMSDPKYDRDPAYRQDVYDKLERSNLLILIMSKAYDPSARIDTMQVKYK